MSDSPGAPASDALDGGELDQHDARALRDVRWLTGIIWAGLLVALLVTSVNAVHAFTQGTLASRVFGPITSFPQDPGDAARSGALAGLCLSALAALAVLGGWIAFARVTKAVVVALADSPTPGAAAAAEWLIVSEDAEPSLITVARTLASDVLVFVGAAWLVIIVTPAILAAVQAYA